MYTNNNIVNGNQIPPDSEIEANGRVVSFDRTTNSFYHTGNVISRGGQYVYTPLTSPIFIGSATQPSQPIHNGYMEPYNPMPTSARLAASGTANTGYQQYGAPVGGPLPNARRNSGASPVRASVRRRTTRRSAAEQVNNTEVDNVDYPVINGNAVPFQTAPEPVSMDDIRKDVMRLSGYKVTVTTEVLSDASVESVQDVIDPESSLYASPSHAFDEWLMGAMLIAGAPYGITASDTSAFKEILRNPRNNENVTKMSKMILGMISIRDNNVYLSNPEQVLITDSVALTDELHSIRSIGMIVIPSNSSLANTLIENSDVSEIWTKKYRFGIRDGHIFIKELLK